LNLTVETMIELVPVDRILTISDGPMQGAVAITVAWCWVHDLLNEVDYFVEPGTKVRML
jgi:hypothetical protein